MADPAGGAVVADLGLEVFKAAVPKGIELQKTWAFGFRMVVVGPQEVGKSSLVEYCQWGKLPPAGVIPRTRELPKGAKFWWQFGPQGRIELHIKRAMALPGQYDHVLQAKLLVAQKPHIAVVMVELGKATQVAWIEAFLTDLAAKLNDAPKVRRRLKTVVFVMNKQDLVVQKTLKSTVKEREKQIRALCEAKLAGILGAKASECPIRPCILAETKHGPELARQLVEIIARSQLRQE